MRPKMAKLEREGGGGESGGERERESGGGRETWGFQSEPHWHLYTDTVECKSHNKQKSVDWENEVLKVTNKTEHFTAAKKPTHTTQKHGGGWRLPFICFMF